MWIWWIRIRIRIRIRNTVVPHGNPQAMTYGFKNLYSLAKKPTTVTRQLTKSIDFPSPKKSFVTFISGDVGDEAGDDGSHPGPRAATRRRDIPEDGGGRQPRTRVVAARRRGGRRSHGTPLLAVLGTRIRRISMFLGLLDPVCRS